MGGLKDDRADLRLTAGLQTGVRATTAVLGDAVLLKGGLVLELRLERARTTKDIDLRVTGSPRWRGEQVVHGAHSPALSLKHTHDCLVLFDVPAVLVVVSRDRYRADVRALRFPETRAGHRRSCNPRSRGAQFAEPDLHSRQDTVELRDVSGSAVVRGDRKDAQHFRVGAIRETNILPHSREVQIQQAGRRFHGVQ